MSQNGHEHLFHGGCHGCEVNDANICLGCTYTDSVGRSYPEHSKNLPNLNTRDIKKKEKTAAEEYSNDASEFLGLNHRFNGHWAPKLENELTKAHEAGQAHATKKPKPVKRWKIDIKWDEVVDVESAKMAIVLSSSQGEEFTEHMQSFTKNHDQVLVKDIPDSWKVEVTKAKAKTKFTIYNPFITTTFV